MRMYKQYFWFFDLVCKCTEFWCSYSGAPIVPGPTSGQLDLKPTTNQSYSGSNNIHRVDHAKSMDLPNLTRQRATTALELCRLSS